MLKNNIKGLVKTVMMKTEIVLMGLTSHMNSNEKIIIPNNTSKRRSKYYHI